MAFERHYNEKISILSLSLQICNQKPQQDRPHLTSWYLLCAQLKQCEVSMPSNTFLEFSQDMQSKEFEGRNATTTASDMSLLRPGFRQRRAERVRRSRLVYDLSDVG